MSRLTRRKLLAPAVVALLPGGAEPIRPQTEAATTPAASALLAASAEAHGRDGFRAVSDISVSYDGRWRGLVDRLQPALVDAGVRGRSQERLLLRDGVSAQAYTGPAGRKYVLRRTVRGGVGSVHVWYDGRPTDDVDQIHAAALVADAYRLFLLGPLLLAGAWRAERTVIMEVGEPQSISLDGRDHACDVLRVSLTPGLGLSNNDQLALYIDRGSRLMRRVRFTVNGLESTQGAVADVDLFDHTQYAGVQWPTRFHEQLLRPLPLPVHDWRLTGLDLNRGLDLAMVSGPALTGPAAALAQPWTRTS